MYIRYIFKLGLLVLFSALIFSVLTACSKQQVKKSELVISTTAQNMNKTQTGTSDGEENYSDSETRKSFKAGEAGTYVVLNGENTVLNGDGVVFENNVLTVTKGGTYYLSGQLTDGRIHVSSTDDKKQVKLCLDGVSVFCDEGVALRVDNSPLKTVIALCDDTVNSFSDTTDKKADEEPNGGTAVIYCEDELQIEGEGVLDIRAEYGKGIFAKENVSILDGYIHIDAQQSNGIDCDGSVNMTDGTVVIFGSPNTKEYALSCEGNFNVSDGTLLVTGDNIPSQSVIGTDGVNVIAHCFYEDKKGLGVIAEQDGEAVVGFKLTEPFGNVLLASEEIEDDEVYSLYEGGNIVGEEYKGVYFDAQYKAGTLVGALS